MQRSEEALGEVLDVKWATEFSDKFEATHLVVVLCKRCWVLVPEAAMAHHAEWHSRLTMFGF